MFDPASNPFAIQNLLERTAPPFVERCDDGDASGFGAGGSAARGFELDRSLQAQSEDFSADTPPDDGFGAAAAQAKAGDDSDFERAGTVAAAGAPAHAAGASDRTHPVSAGAGGAGVASARTAHERLSATQAAAAPTVALGPDSAQLAQMLDAARAEAYARGLHEGQQQRQMAALDEARPPAHREGYDEGRAAGIAQAQAEQQAEDQQAQQVRLEQLQSVIDGLRQLMYDPDAMFEPMKKLALHLAEQLVRGELSQSPQAISRLVDNALRELSANGDKPVLVHLHPEDLELYKPTVAQYTDSLHLRPDSKLERGSVRASLEGSVVEDMIQRRVDGLKTSLAQPATPGWRSGRSNLAERVQHGQPVEDVTPLGKAAHEAEAATAEGHG